MAIMTGIVNANQAVAGEDLDGDYFRVSAANQVQPRQPGGLIHMHRITAGDNPRIDTFSGQQYRLTDGWIPSLAATNFAPSNSNYTNVGLNWRVNAGGVWELYGGVLGVNETWTLDIVFRKLLPSQISTFGAFT
jgi:hypothetical protein